MEAGEGSVSDVEMVTPMLVIYTTLCSISTCETPPKEALRMASVQFTDVQARPTEFLDLTSLTLNEFQPIFTQC